jgi:DinB superfamily
MENPDDLRYPIGKFGFGQPISLEQTQDHIRQISQLPNKLAELVSDWADDRLDTPYRPDGWTVRQTMHHLADSHINAYVRTKLLLTEDNPTIKPYEQQHWAELPDSRLPVAPSLLILSNVHLRWGAMLGNLPAEAFARTYFHPGDQRTFTLTEVLGLYAWHGEHHYQHIRRLAGRNQWV